MRSEAAGPGCPTRRRSPFRRPPARHAPTLAGHSNKSLENSRVNTVIYIVGLVVVIAAILSFFGLR
nr:hypothetical protein [Xenophilus azovorans]